MLQLIRTGNDTFDLAIDDGSDATAVETIIYAALYTDAEAPDSVIPDRVPDRFARSGWWADPARGSPLWHLRRQPLHAAARREAINAVRLALINHGISDPVVDEVVGQVAGNVSALYLDVGGIYAGRAVIVRIPL